MPFREIYLTENSLSCGPQQDRDLFMPKTAVQHLDSRFYSDSSKRCLVAVDRDNRFSPAVAKAMVAISPTRF